MIKNIIYERNLNEILSEEVSDIYPAYTVTKEVNGIAVFKDGHFVRWLPLIYQGSINAAIDFVVDEARKERTRYRQKQTKARNKAALTPPPLPNPAQGE